MGCARRLGASAPLCSPQIGVTVVTSRVSLGLNGSGLGNRRVGRKKWGQVGGADGTKVRPLWGRSQRSGASDKVVGAPGPPASPDVPGPGSLGLGLAEAAGTPGGKRGLELRSQAQAELPEAGACPPEGVASSVDGRGYERSPATRPELIGQSGQGAEPQGAQRGGASVEIRKRAWHGRGGGNARRRGHVKAGRRGGA